MIGTISTFFMLSKNQHFFVAPLNLSLKNVVIVSIVPMLNLFDIYYRMIRKFPQLMPKESGLLTLTRVFQKPKLFTHRVGGEKSYCQMKGKCMVSGYHRPNIKQRISYTILICSDFLS